MNACWQTFQDYALRSIGIGERLLPRHDFTWCEQVVLIGSGMIWNIYLAAVALITGFVLANALALAKTSHRRSLRRGADGFILLFRGSPLFIQFFLFYSAAVLLPREGVQIAGITLPTWWLSKAWCGALIVLMLNTAAYSAQIFHGALMQVPKGEVEAADAFGMIGWARFRRIIWPTTMRLAWPAYTNEAIFLFHATALVFFSSFPAFRQSGDALYYASYIAGKTFNPFVAYPIVAGYFILMTLILTALFGAVNRYLNRHLPGNTPRLRYRPKLLR